MSVRLSAIETALEQRGSPIHVGSVSLFEAAPLCDRRGKLRIGELRARIGSRLDQLPRLRQRVMQVPLGLARPVWVDDPTFDVANHVEAVELPAPGDERALARLAAELQVRPFTSDHPMWQLCFVTGVSGNRVALVERVHHAMVDGVSGVDVATILLDVDRSVSPTTTSTWVAAPPPSSSRLLVESLTDQTRAMRGLVSSVVRAVAQPRMLVGGVAEIARVVGGVAGHGLAAPRSSLNRPAGGDRSLAFIRQDLAAVKAAGRADGATVNDVVLSAVAGGLRSLYLARGESLPHELHATVLVPVSLRDDAARGTLGNRVGALLLPLPVGVGDPRTRLRDVASASATMKARREVLTSEVVQGAADFVPAQLVAPLSGLITHQPLANLVVTNVPGPTFPLYAMGAEMLEAFPVVPLSGNLTLGVAALSYNGALNLGVTADTDACPDVDSFVAGVEQSFARLGAIQDVAVRRVG